MVHETSPLLEPVNALFSHVALPIDVEVEAWWRAGAPDALVAGSGIVCRMPHVARAAGSSGSCSPCPRPAAPRALARRCDSTRALNPDSVEDRLKLGTLVTLAQGYVHLQRPASAIAGQVQLGRQHPRGSA
jgi:hypothetical protein